MNALKKTPQKTGKIISQKCRKWYGCTSVKRRDLLSFSVEFVLAAAAVRFTVYQVFFVMIPSIRSAQFLPTFYFHQKYTYFDKYKIVYAASQKLSFSSSISKPSQPISILRFIWETAVLNLLVQAHLQNKLLQSTLYCVRVCVAPHARTVRYKLLEEKNFFSSRATYEPE